MFQFKLPYLFLFGFRNKLAYLIDCPYNDIQKLNFSKEDNKEIYRDFVCKKFYSRKC